MYGEILNHGLTNIELTVTYKP